MTIRRLARPAALAATALLVLTGCQSDSDPTDPGASGPTGMTVTGPSTSLEAGSTLQLTASVQPAGAPQGVTWSTSDATVATVDGAGLVSGIGPGSVVITATSTADPNISASITLSCTCPAPRTVSSTPNGDTTWENWIPSPACFDYVVTTRLIMTSGVLTVLPGTVIGFEAGTRLQLTGSNAGIFARGTSQDQIRLTGTQPVRGHWEGVLLQNTAHERNHMSFTTIEYAGVGQYSGSVIRANLMLIENTEIDMVYVTLQESAGYGLSMNSTASAPRWFGGSTFTRNALGPANVHASVLHYLTGADQNIDLSGNDRDVVDVRPNVVPAATFPPLEWDGAGGAAFRILEANNRLALQVNGALKVTGGAVIEFEEDMGMVVLGQGSLVAAGTAADPVVFRGAEPTPGHWRGIGAAGDVLVSLDHVIVEGGGSAPIGSGSHQPANLLLYQGAANTTTRARVTNTILRGSAGYGLFSRSNQVEIDDFSGNTLTANALGAAFVDAPIVDRLMAGDYTGNGIDRVHVNAGGTASIPITTDATWRNPGVPYIVHAGAPGGVNLVVQGASLTIEPGANLRFTPGMGLLVHQGASLNAVGTANQRITFQGDGGTWRGIGLVESGAHFEHVTFQGGGSSSWLTAQQPGNVTVASAGQNASVASFGAGIQSSSASQFQLVFTFGPTFGLNCANMAPFYVPPPDVPPDHCPQG